MTTKGETMADENLFKLLVGNTRSNSATMPVRWCTSQELLAKLEEKGVEDPHVLIVVREAGGHKEKRWVRPLADAICFITFRKPGDNLVFATVVWEKDEKTPNDLYLSRDYRDYRTTVLGDNDN